MKPQATMLPDLAVLDALTDHVCIMDEDGRILAANRAWREFAAANPPLPQRAGVGANYHTVCEAATGEDTATAREALRGLRAVAQGALPEFMLEYPCHSPDTQRWFEMRATRLAGEAPGKVVVTHTNVTQRKLAESAMRESEERFRAIADYTADLECWFGQDGRLLWVNPAVERITGYSVAECFTLPNFPAPLFPLDEVDRCRASFQEALRGSRGSDWEFRFLRKDGTKRWGSVAWQPIYSGEGTRLGHRSSVRDITERKLAEESLRASEELLRITLENILDPVFITDDAGAFTFICPNIPSILGYALEELQAMGSISPLLGKALFALNDLKSRGEIHNLECEIVKKNGRRHDYLVTVKRVAIGKGTVLYVCRDITERKQAEATLRESEERYRSLVASSLDAVLLTAPDGRIFAANAAACAVFGCSEAELVALGREGIVDRFDPRLEPALRERARTGRIRAELTFIRPDGSRFEGEVSSSVFCTSGGEARTSMVIRDITERKRLEGALHDAAARRAALFEQTPVGLVVLDPWSKRILDFNATAHEQLGYSHEEFARLDLSSIEAKEDAAAIEAHIACVLREGGDDFVTQQRTKAGEVRDMRVIVKRVDLTQGTVFQCICEDITHRKQAEAALRQAGLYNRRLIEASLDPLVTIGPDGNITDANGATELATGYSRAELVGRDFSDYFTEPEQARAGYQRVFREGSVRDYPLEIRHRAGRTIPVLYNAAVYRDETGKVIGVFAAARDITERKQSEEEMRRLARRLLEAEAAERRRLARELHDSTAQKIAGLIMSLGRIEDVLGSADGEIRRRLGEAQALAQDCARELRTTSHLLHPPLLEEMGLEVALDTYIAGFSQRSGIAVQTDLPADLGRLPAEQEMVLFRVVQESLGNIHRHSGSRTATVQLTRFPERLVLEVQDQGRGIPEEQLHRITDQASALGVGIAGMQERLRQLGGVLEIDSTSAGTTVRAMLPVHGITPKAEDKGQAAS